MGLHGQSVCGDSFFKYDGTRVVLLSPEEGNPNGFSIRFMIKELVARREKISSCSFFPMKIRYIGVRSKWHCVYVSSCFGSV